MRSVLFRLQQSHTGSEGLGDSSTLTSWFEPTLSRLTRSLLCFSTSIAMPGVVRDLKI